MGRFAYTFTAWIWQHLPFAIRKLEDGIIGRFTKTLLYPFEAIIITIANNLYDQIFLDSSSISSLQKHGAMYGLSQGKNEGAADYLRRLRVWRLIISSGGVKKSIKSAMNIFTGIDESVITVKEGIDSVGAPAFIIGGTPIGTGCIIHSTQIFTFTIILPDLSAVALNRSFILKALDEFSPSNEFKIIEKRSGYDYEWEAV